MKFPMEGFGIDEWIKDRAKEANVFCAQCSDTGAFAGLLLLHDTLEHATIPTFNIGYFIREDCWGKGYATEAICAILAALGKEHLVHLVAGVDKCNSASARVLEKAGFRRVAEQSTADRDHFEYPIIHQTKLTTHFIFEGISAQDSASWQQRGR